MSLPGGWEEAVEPQPAAMGLLPPSVLNIRAALVVSCPGCYLGVGRMQERSGVLEKAELAVQSQAWPVPCFVERRTKARYGVRERVQRARMPQSI